MFADTIAITWNSVSKTLTRQTSGTYAAKYGLDDAGLRYFTLRIEHTVPPSSTSFGETHMARLDVAHYDATGKYLRTDSTWQVMKTTDSKQNSIELDYTAQALVDFLTDANIDKLIAREA